MKNMPPPSINPKNSPYLMQKTGYFLFYFKKIINKMYFFVKKNVFLQQNILF